MMGCCWSMIDKFQEFVKLKYGIAKALLDADDEKMFVVHRRSGTTTAMRMVEEFRCKDNYKF